jgi:hypothetical protein
MKLIYTSDPPQLRTDSMPTQCFTTILCIIIMRLMIVSPFLPWIKTKELNAPTFEMDCNQTAMGSPPVTSAVFLIAESFW